MIVILVQFFISRGEISDIFVDDFFRGFYDFGADVDSTKFVDYIQKKFACCGLENSSDWEMNRPYNRVNQAPDSCCKPEFGKKCDKSDASQLQEIGCVSMIIAWSTSHSYIFLVLWFVLILLSICFCLVLKLISKQGHSEPMVDIKSFFSSSESENLMSANKKLLDYQNSFKKCNPKQVQIGFTLNDDQLSANLNSNLNKLARYSQIRYSKVKPAHAESDEHTELTCHQEHRDDLSYEEGSVSSESSDHTYQVPKQIKQVNSCDKLDKTSKTVEKTGKLGSGDKIDQTTTNASTKLDQKGKNELQKAPSIKSIDRATAGGKPKSIKKQSTKPHKHTKDSADCKSNPNYDPHYSDSLKERKESQNLSVNENVTKNGTKNATKGHSPSSSESSTADDLQTERRNLIHPKHEKTMYLNKLKNKFIDQYSDCSSYLTDDFDEDESDDVSTMQDRSNEWLSSDSSFGLSDGCHENRKKSLRVNLGSHRSKRNKSQCRKKKNSRRNWRWSKLEESQS